mmetsp:Transcript_7068/g.21734  ORF Transcript_7068/g.21734 Transcript_7068/m.21734 type:complete len:92 (-) Transcript_7068:2875-3150(-)
MTHNHVLSPCYKSWPRGAIPLASHLLGTLQVEELGADIFTTVFKKGSKNVAIILGTTMGACHCWCLLHRGGHAAIGAARWNESIHKEWLQY